MKRIIIVSTRAGCHWSAAHALAVDLLSAVGLGASVEVVDILSSTYSKFPATILPELYEFVARNIPWLCGLVYDRTNNWGATRFIRRFSRALFRRSSIEPVVRKADLIISTMWDLGQLSVVKDLMAAYGLSPPIVTVVLDPVTVHKAWGSSASDFYAATTSLSGAACSQQFAAAPERIIYAEFPVRRTFKTGQDDDTSWDLGFGPNFPKALFMGGSAGTGNVERDVLAVADARLAVRMIIVCGHNQRLMRSLLRKLDPRSARVFGFVSDPSTLVRACDVVVTKAGAGTIAEAAACGRPVIITRALPGPETGNIEYFAQQGFAVLATTPQALVSRLRRLSNEGAEAFPELRTLDRNQLTRAPQAVDTLTLKLAELCLRTKSDDTHCSDQLVFSRL